MKSPKPLFATSDIWAGLAAMLVALPSAIAFGVTIYATLGPSYAAFGALAGILGAMALGLIAPMIGGATKLITAPCAPAAAVLTAFAITQIQNGIPAEAVILLMVLLGLMAGGLQLLFGVIGLGRLIKYMPYPVVSGYLSGVGIIIIASQIPKYLGLPDDANVWLALIDPTQWQWQGMIVGAVTAFVMLAGPYATKLIPSAILGLAAGGLTYFGLGQLDSSLLTLDKNPLVIGALNTGEGSFTESLATRWNSLSDLALDAVMNLFLPAITLAVLLSIDTLKTCLVLDALTRSRHDSNRVLIGQGCSNIGAAMVGGIPGAGTMGPTLVNISSGAQTRFSGISEGVFSLIAFVLLASVIAWVPVASLAAILIVIGFKMIDTHSLRLLKSRSTLLDFIVIAAVIATAIGYSLIAASAIGIVLAVFLFIREHIGGQVVHRKLLGNEHFSKRIRSHKEMEILSKKGDDVAIFELQGSVFFGTTDQLYKALEKDLEQRRYLILDMRRVQSVDVTATHLLEQIQDTLKEKGGQLLFSHIPHNLPSGKDIEQYFDKVGLVRSEQKGLIFEQLNDALEWTEDKLIEEAGLEDEEHRLFALDEFDMFKGRKEATLKNLESMMTQCHFKAGERIFAKDDTGDELYLIRRGDVRIVLPVNSHSNISLAIFGQGSFFGEMAFLDHEKRSADAIALTDTDLFVLSRATFDQIAHEHKKASLKLLEGLASTLSTRLRYTNGEIRALES